MLSDNIWWTRKSRIQAAERLLSDDFHTQLILVWYSLFSVCTAIYYLKFDPQSDLAQVSMTIYAVMILSISLFMSGRNFKERGMLMKQCYLQLDYLYRNAKLAEESNHTNSLLELSGEYQNVVNSSENHKEIDFILATVKLKLSGNDIDKKVTKYHYFKWVSYYVFRMISFSVFYVLPILFLYVLKLI